MSQPPPKLNWSSATQEQLTKIYDIKNKYTTSGVIIVFLIFCATYIISQIIGDITKNSISKLNISEIINSFGNPNTATAQIITTPKLIIGLAGFPSSKKLLHEIYKDATNIGGDFDVATSGVLPYMDAQQYLFHLDHNDHTSATKILDNAIANKSKNIDDRVFGSKLLFLLAIQQLSSAINDKNITTKNATLSRVSQILSKSIEEYKGNCPAAKYLGELAKFSNTYKQNIIDVNYFFNHVKFENNATFQEYNSENARHTTCAYYYDVNLTMAISEGRIETINRVIDSAVARKDWENFRGSMIYLYLHALDSYIIAKEGGRIERMIYHLDSMSTSGTRIAKIYKIYIILQNLDFIKNVGNLKDISIEIDNIGSFLNNIDEGSGNIDVFDVFDRGTVLFYKNFITEKMKGHTSRG